MESLKKGNRNLTPALNKIGSGNLIPEPTKSVAEGHQIIETLAFHKIWRSEDLRYINIWGRSLTTAPDEIQRRFKTLISQHVNRCFY